MFKKSLLALAVLGSSSAFATTQVQTTTPINFANELFGTSNAVLGGTGVNVVANITNNVSNGATASFTYTLSNGTFGANPTLTFANAGATTGSAGTSLTSGGAGSSSATFTVVVTEEFTGDETFTLNVPSLTGTDTLGTAGNSVSAILSVDNTNIVATPFVEAITNQGAPASTLAVDSRVATSTAGMTQGGIANAGVADIDVADQTQFDGGLDGQDIFQNITVTNTTAAQDQTGATPFALAASDSVVITVAGNVAEGATICLAADAAVDCSTQVGTAVTTTSGSTITLTGAQAAGLAGTEDIVYALDGTNSVPVSEFSISSEITYGNAAYAGTISYDNAATVSLGISGLTEKADSVNIITKPGAADATFIRVTNRNSTATEAYINLTTQDGSATAFGSLGSIAANATVVYDSQAIADAVGLSTWSGRGNAILSFSGNAAFVGNVVVVPLVRTNDVLTNQSGSL